MAAATKVVTMHEQREWPRYAAERSFALSAIMDGQIYPCTVADVSLGGARLVFDEPLPDDPLGGGVIELSHPDADTVACAPIWRSSHQVGIRFDFSEDSLDLISVCLRNMIDLDRSTAI